jgi:hypothetical protein
MQSGFQQQRGRIVVVQRKIQSNAKYTLKLLKNQMEELIARLPTKKDVWQYQRRVHSEEKKGTRKLLYYTFPIRRH